MEKKKVESVPREKAKLSGLALINHTNTCLSCWESLKSIKKENTSCGYDGMPRRFFRPRGFTQA
jgi:hypothetical protein